MVDILGDLLCNLLVVKNMRSLFIRNSYLLSRPLGRFQKVGIKSPALNAVNRRLMQSLSTSSAGGGPGASSIKRMEEHVNKFDLGTTVESAVTPPTAWFTHPEMFELDKVRPISKFINPIKKMK